MTEDLKPLRDENHKIWEELKKISKQLSTFINKQIKIHRVPTETEEHKNLVRDMTLVNVEKEEEISRKEYELLKCKLKKYT